MRDAEDAVTDVSTRLRLNEAPGERLNKESLSEPLHWDGIRVGVSLWGLPGGL